MAAVGTNAKSTSPAISCGTIWLVLAMKRRVTCGEEHLVTSDKAIRRLFEQQMKIVEEGGDPIGTHFEPGSEYVRLAAGSFIRAAAAA